MGGRPVGLEGQRILLGIAACLMRAVGGPIPVAELFSRVWGRPFRGDSDLGTLQFHVSALRARLSAAAPGTCALVTRNGELLLSAGPGWLLIESAEMHGARRTDERGLMELLAERRFIDNRGLRELRASSRMTALRRLRALVAAGRVVREGKGRGARYRVVDDEVLA